MRPTRAPIHRNILWKDARPRDLRRCVAWNQPQPSARPWTRSPPGLAATAGPALPGTLTVRAYACGKPSCRCHADPPRLHGPYAEWTRKIAGKTITSRLTPAELAEYQPLFDNAKNLRALLTELQDLTLEITGGRQAAGGRKASRTGRMTSAKRGLSTLNLWAALQPDPRLRRSPLNVKTSPRNSRSGLPFNF